MSLQKLMMFIHSSCGTYDFAFTKDEEMNERDLIPVMLGCHYTFSPQLFSQAAVDFPMRMCSWIVGVGSTAADIYRTVETADSHRTVLLSGVSRLVCMDFVRGVSVPFPYSEKRLCLSSYLPPTAYRFPSIAVPAAAPDRSYMATVKVRYEDMDVNWHSNHSSYTAFALECAAQAAAAGYYSRIREDIVFYRARSLTCLHLGESFAGDELDVGTWEDIDDALLLHFLVVRQKRRIFYIKIDFDENIISSKL